MSAAPCVTFPCFLSAMVVEGVPPGSTPQHLVDRAVCSPPLATSRSGELAQGLRALKTSLSEAEAQGRLVLEMERRLAVEAEVARLKVENERLRGLVAGAGHGASEACALECTELVEHHCSEPPSEPPSRPLLAKSASLLTHGPRGSSLDACQNTDLTKEAKRDREASMDRSLAERIKKQNRWDREPIEAIIFEGGGTKGIVYAGAIQRLDDEGLMKNIKFFAGTSAGAQTAALAAVGYTGQELAEVMRTTPWAKLMDKSSFMGCLGCFPNMWRLVTQYGLCKGEVLQTHLEKLIARKMGPGCTLKRLYDERGVVLRVGACNVTSRKFELLDYLTHPEMSVSTAARASSNIPLVFVPVKYDTKKGDMPIVHFVDGGLEGNIPMKAFPSKKCLAFDLMNTSDWTTGGHRHIVPESLWHFGSTLLEMVMDSAQAAAGMCQAMGIRKIENVQICKIHCGDHGMLETKLSSSQVSAMVASGWDAVDTFLQKPDPD